MGTRSDIYQQGPPSLPPSLQQARYTRNRCGQIVLFALTAHKVQMCSSSTCPAALENWTEGESVWSGTNSTEFAHFARLVWLSFAQFWPRLPADQFCKQGLGRFSPARSKALPLLHLSKPWTMSDYEVHHGRRIKATGQQSFVVAWLCLKPGGWSVEMTQ